VIAEGTVSDSIEADLLVERHEQGVVLLTLNRPRSRNALNRRLADSLLHVLVSLERETGLSVIVLTGAGGDAFCAGADLIERRQMSPQERKEHTLAIEAVADKLAASPVPTIAAVNGHALAGGAELAIACDMRVASRTAIFGFPEVRIGIFPGAGGVMRLPRLVGVGAARVLLFTGRQIDAPEALRLGLVDRVAPDVDAVPAALELAITIAENAPLAIRALKRALREDARSMDDQAAANIRLLRQQLDDTRDYAEGLAAFAERRSPRFTGQ
jgi:enoyl-CoA hydratase/carnithine racemase